MLHLLRSALPFVREMKIQWIPERVGVFFFLFPAFFWRTQEPLGLVGERSLSYGHLAS